jgi:hypothetical protein
MKKPHIQNKAVLPVVPLALPRHVAKPTSKKPATISKKPIHKSRFINLKNYKSYPAFPFLI